MYSSNLCNFFHPFGKVQCFSHTFLVTPTHAQANFKSECFVLVHLMFLCHM